MKSILLSLCLLLAIPVLSQERDLIINTGKPFLLKRNISAFDDGNTDDPFYILDPTFVIWGFVEYKNFQSDTLYLQLKDQVPILITGLQKLSCNSIRIQNLPNVNYTPIDTIITETTKYNKEGSLDKNSITKKMKTPNNSSKLDTQSRALIINGNTYYSRLYESDNSFTTYFCTPGEISTVIEQTGVEYMFVFHVE